MLASLLLSAASVLAPAIPYKGADISALPSLEAHGALYRDEAGKPGDCLAILRAHGFNVFRVRLFVHPRTEARGAGGPTQDLPAVQALADRIKSSGAKFMLDLHYSDTWADPQHQVKPAAWEGLHGEALGKQVHDYTAEVLAALAKRGTPPDFVQLGNEITPGFLWPDGQLSIPADAGATRPANEPDEGFGRLARLLAPAFAAAREASPGTRTIIHIDGGGKPGRPQWFFSRLFAQGIEPDEIALSFYPAWGESLPALKANLADLGARWHKPVFIAETSCPYKPMRLDAKYAAALLWPQSAEGQLAFVRDLNAVLLDAHAQGYVWWYPEAVHLDGQRAWRDGAEGLFGGEGTALPAMAENP